MFPLILGAILGVAGIATAVSTRNNAKSAISHYEKVTKELRL